MLLKEQEIKENFHAAGKFKNEKITAKGEDRAFVEMESLETLWFNTGTRCNLECVNCYIESSPYNDELVYISTEEVESYLNEIESLSLSTQQIAFTGGEPFLNPDMLPITELCLQRGFHVLILTNAYRAIDKHIVKLDSLNQAYPGKITLRVSLDHHRKEIHEEQRGTKTFDKTLKTMKSLVDHGFNVTIAGRSLAGEQQAEALFNYQKTLDKYGVDVTVSNGDNIVIFPEMSTENNVPEITTACWDILNVRPLQQMCASERMIIKRKGSDHPVIMPCTLIAYDKQFEMGKTLEESFRKVYLNHPYCAQFCVLGGASCSV